MEKQNECAVINIPNIKADNEQQKGFKKKKKGGILFLRVAVFMMRGRSKKPSVLQVDDDDDKSKSIWRKIVGSMRPLHLQSTQSPRSFSQPNTTFTSPSPTNDYVVEEEPYSPSPPSSCYASAVGLNELVQNDEDNDKQETIMEGCECDGHVNVDAEPDGDEMIDAKAEDFIAQFYQEIRLQRLNSVDRLYVERSQRSLGC
ncbi:hypothetical protein VNO78_18104 [Psophocarpus tetragonolobus]|uniref:Cotton fiber protein n=1 Tax=Psophocarpus tetragonolobus TaxID=3891 RepID=A0AAN9XLV9_PSOTE